MQSSLTRMTRAVHMDSYQGERVSRIFVVLSLFLRSSRMETMLHLFSSSLFKYSQDNRRTVPT